jgi:hypothetical protein
MFAVHGIDKADRAARRSNLLRVWLEAFVAPIEPTQFVMEGRRRR